MNHYEERQEAKRERLENRAARLRAVSQGLHARAHVMAEAIPFGQPILIGHHSEGRDRNYRAKITRTFRASFEMEDKAKAAQARADRIGTGGISSDDPSALDKLRSKVANLEASHKAMVQANRIIRKSGSQEAKIPELVALGFSAEQAARLFVPDCFQIIGFAGFSLSNSKGRINQVKERITALERKQRAAEALTAETGEPAKEKTFKGFTFREDLEENRFMFLFPGKPDEQTRGTLKGHGFRWSPTRAAWVRQITPNGRWAAERVISSLAGQE